MNEAKGNNPTIKKAFFDFFNVEADQTCEKCNEKMYCIGDGDIICKKCANVSTSVNEKGNLCIHIDGTKKAKQ